MAQSSHLALLLVFFLVTVALAAKENEQNTGKGPQKPNPGKGEGEGKGEGPKPPHQSPPSPYHSPPPPPQQQSPPPPPQQQSPPPPQQQSPPPPQQQSPPPPQQASPPPPLQQQIPPPPQQQSPPPPPQQQSPPTPQQQSSPPPQQASSPPPSQQQSPPPPQQQSPPSPSQQQNPPPPPQQQNPSPPPTISTPPPPSQSPSEGPSPPAPKPKKVGCSNGQNVAPFCRGVKADCPSTCPQSCTMDCQSTCKPVCVCDKPGACGDPRFIGGDGNSFYFHGRKDHDFCIVSDSDLHINAHFIGKRSLSMTRDFTWIEAIAVLFGEHRLYIGAKKTAIWDDDSDHLEISFDGEHVHVPEINGAKWKSLYVPALEISRTLAVNTITIELKGRFKIIANAVPITKEDSRIHKYGVTSDDCLAHLDLAFRFDVLTSNVHGVVGQTYRPDYVNKFDVRTKMPVLGGVINFSTSGLFTADCAVARFRRGEGEVELLSGLADVKCASGMDGPGVVCKK